MAREVNREVEVPLEPRRVWAVLTDSHALEEVFAQNDFEPVEGRTFQFRTKPRPGFDGIIDCEVIEVADQRRLSYTWQASQIPHPTTVTWHLEPTATGTRVRLEHSGFEGIRGTVLAFMHSSGWNHILKKLEDYLQQAS